MTGVSLCLLALLGSTFRTGMLADYRIPDTRASVWTVSFWPRTYYHTDSAGRFAAAFGFEPAWFYGVNSKRLHLDSRLSAASEAKPLLLEFTDTTRTRSHSYVSRPQFALSADWYPSRLPIGLRAEPRFTGTLSSTQTPQYRDRRVDLDGTGFVGPVFGRVRDATPVVTALRVAEVLAAEDQLASELTEADIQYLAELMARRWTYQAKHERSDKYFYQELERFLGPRSRDGARLSARTWFRIRDEVGRAGYSGYSDYPERLVGIRLALTAGGVYNRRWQTTIQETETTKVDEKWDRKMAVAELDGGWPLSLRLHFSGTARWQWEFFPYGAAHDFTSELGLSYLAGELLLLRASLEPRIMVRSDTSGWWRQVYDAAATLSAVWQVEDRFSVSASTRLHGAAETAHNTVPERHLGTDLSLNFGYRIR